MAQKLVMPLLGSKLGNAEKEAMVGILLEIMESKGRKPGDKIYVSEFLAVTEQMKAEGRLPIVYRMQFQNCWNAVWEMRDEGLLAIHQKTAGELEESWMTVTEDLVKLVSPETPEEIKKEIVARSEENKKKAEEVKVAQEEKKRELAEKERQAGTFKAKLRKLFTF